MKTSESIDQLAAALSALQGEVRDVVKDQQGYGYKFADLAQVLQHVRPLLARTGLALSQHIERANNEVTVETLLLHASGQWLSSTMMLPIEEKRGLSRAQCVGMAASYLRRYAVCAVLGIAAEDDDAQADREQGLVSPGRATRGETFRDDSNSPAPPLSVPLDEALQRVAQAATIDQLKALFREVAAAYPGARARIIEACSRRKRELERTDTEDDAA